MGNLSLLRCSGDRIKNRSTCIVVHTRTGTLHPATVRPPVWGNVLPPLPGDVRGPVICPHHKIQRNSITRQKERKESKGKKGKKGKKKERKIDAGKKKKSRTERRAKRDKLEPRPGSHRGLLFLLWNFSRSPGHFYHPIPPQDSKLKAPLSLINRRDPSPAKT